MISILELSYELDQRLNKLTTFAHQSIPVEDKVIALNNSQIKLVKNKVSSNNSGMDVNKKRYQDLQFLIENTEDHPLKLTLSDKKLNRYIAKTTDLSPKFMFYVDSYLIADKGNCKDRVIYVNTDLVKHADITLLLQNNNYKPSFEYQDTIGDISSDELHYYSDGTFAPKKAYVSYIRYPKDIDIDGYVKFDGSTSTNIDSEFEYYLKDELLDLAVEYLAMFTENQPAVQYTQNRINKNE